VCTWSTIPSKSIRLTTASRSILTTIASRSIHLAIASMFRRLTITSRSTRIQPFIQERRVHAHPTAGRGHPGEATHHRRDHAGAGSGRSSLHRGWNTARRSVRTIERIATEYAAPWRRLLAAVTLRGRDEWLRARAGEADGDRREHDDGKHTRADECCGVLGQHHA
jgi:hypothetical protein